MYEYIKGVITSIQPSYIVVETNQIGYQIVLGNPYQYTPQKNQEAIFFVHQVIREDSQALYGFTSLEEKKLFLRLISVSGIGPKSALAIMTNEDHQGLITAVETEDVNFLVKFPGVGKKTAQQMILDLKGKLDELVSEESWPLAGNEQESSTQMLDEALAALTALGYSDREIKRVSKDLVQTNEKTTDDYLREALKLMMKK